MNSMKSIFLVALATTALFACEGESTVITELSTAQGALVDSDNDGVPDVDELVKCGPAAVLLSSVRPAAPGIPAAPEICDALDNDCDGLTDEDPTTNIVADLDKDGIADCRDDDMDGDGVTNDADCAPKNADISPQASEVCDGHDNDCDGKTDEENAVGCTKFYLDEDGDTYGSSESLCLCAPFGEYDADHNGDCNDGDASVYPNAPEQCNGKDDNCNGTIDDESTDTDHDGKADCVDTDDDNDGTTDSADCAPLNKDIHPNAVELCDGVDQNCDGVTDEGFVDTDHDGKADCVDTDDDNDGVLDVTDNCPLVPNPAQVDTDNDGKGDACTSDKDGDGDPDTTDCKPLDPTVHHGAAEKCDGIDQDCDGVADNGFADLDNDGLADCVEDDTDGDGDPDSTDCAPLNPLVHHNVVNDECNGVDDDCDGVTDENPTAATGKKYYLDGDKDGYGIAGTSLLLCAPSAPFTALQAGDCKDGQASINPGATDICGNGIDEDCSGQDAVCGCTPSCAGKICGADGCGGFCGSCAVDEKCPADGQACLPLIEGGACDNGTDDDEDGKTDCADPDCGTDAACQVSPQCVTNVDCNDANPNTTDACVSGVCKHTPVQPESCQTNSQCPDGYYCAAGMAKCFVFMDQHGRTPQGASGASGGPLADGTADNFDNDGDGYCEVAPCVGSSNPAKLVADLQGGDCDDDPSDDPSGQFSVGSGANAFLTDGSYGNHPGATDWKDGFDNACKGGSFQ